MKGQILVVRIVKFIQTRNIEVVDTPQQVPQI